MEKMRRSVYLFILLSTAGHLNYCTGQIEAGKGSLEEIEDKLDLYDKDSSGKEFVKVLSWSYDAKLELYLSDFIMKLDPTIIAIQNITSNKYKELASLFSNYEASGISTKISGDEIINPIMYKGDRLRPVMEEKFTGVINSKDFGQISWAQFYLSRSQLKNTRKKRDLPDSIIGRVFESLRPSSNEGRSCNIPGSIIVMNTNMKDTKERPHMFNTIYKDVFCQRRKKSFLAGNVGWTKSHSAVYKFAKRMLNVNTFKLEKERNVNQIWSYDFQTVNDLSFNVRSYNGDDLTRKVTEKMIISPTFVAFHFDSVKTDK